MHDDIFLHHTKRNFPKQIIKSQSFARKIKLVHLAQQIGLIRVNHKSNMHTTALPEIMVNRLKCISKNTSSPNVNYCKMKR